MNKTISITLLTLISIISLNSCRQEDKVIPSEDIPVTPGEESELLKGFFLLNEGNMGNNKATLDYFDFTTGIYTKNIYGERNPGVVKELGDVGNDIQIYGNKLYAVINCSNFIEVMNAKTARHIATISIPNCRYITFKDGYAYISSYAGPVQIDPNSRPGYIAKVDTTDFKIISTCLVGYQPEEMVISGNKLYVANSGGYRVPNYDNTVSVIDLVSFKEVKKIKVAINLHRMEIDRYGYIYASSRGDYYNIPSDVFIIDSKTDEVTDHLNIPASNMCISGDSIYMYSTEWNYTTGENTISYAIVNTETRKVVSRNFITDGTENRIEIPYGIAVNPVTKEILVTDAKDYVTPGTLYCFSPDGKKKWEVTTGDIPAHIVFTQNAMK